MHFTRGREGRRRVPGRRRVLFFGTYDARLYARVAVLQEGFAALGDEVLECNVPLRIDTAMRVRMLRQPWLAAVLAVRLLRTWWSLWRQARRLPMIDLVVVGYMGHFDVHLARWLWPRVPIVLDHLLSASDTAVDRRVSSRVLVGLLDRLDRAALRAADVPCVDTADHLSRVRGEPAERAVVVPVGASEQWFKTLRPRVDEHLRVVFFGSFTPLQGAPVIGEAIGLLADEPTISFTMVGRGQDFEVARAAAARSASVRWIDWLELEDLAELVAEHDVCLGIFGTSAKAQRVVPTKVFQGAAAGAAIVTSDTRPQRDALAEAAVFVPPGDVRALADALRALAADRAGVEALRRAACERARTCFRPDAIVAPLRARLGLPAAA